MKRNDGPVSDPMVDLYRGLLATNAAIADAEKRLTSTPGAGRDCKPSRFVPSKRLKAAHRAIGKYAPLRQYARQVVRDLNAYSADDKRAAVLWLHSKGARP